MKKYILIIFGLLYCAFSYSQNSKDPKDKFTYKKIKIKDVDKGELSLTDEGSNSSDQITSQSVAAFSSGADPGIGETEGALTVSLTGGSTYEVPIKVPPGINGNYPEISLRYNSQTGDGVVAYGWDITGVSVISRIASTKYHDGVYDPVDFDNLDRFALDGQRLVLKSGTYGAHGAEYETENYSNLKIISYNVSPYGANYGPSYFIVYYPDGSKGYYGKNPDSNSRANYAISYWENPQGVRISYEYTQSKNSLSISKIKYGGRNGSNDMNEIQFNYSDRYRAEHAYLGGEDFVRETKISSINVLSGGVGYKNYLLSTSAEYKTNYDKLNYITEKSGDNTLSHTAIHFIYDESGNTVDYVGVTTDLGLNNIEQRNSETVSLDLSGDGKMDFIVYPKSITEKNKFWIFKDIQTGSFNYPIQVNSGAFERIFPVTWLTHTDKILSGQGITVIQKDLNNLITFKVYSNGTANPIYYQYEKSWNAPTYSEAFDCTHTPFQNNVDQEYLSGDFDGDGLTDIIAVSRPYSYTTCISVPCDGGGGPPSPLSVQLDTINKDNKTAISPNRVPGTGDCCECTPHTYNYSRATLINLDRRVTSGYIKTLGNLSSVLKTTDKLFTGDVNGDGKSDIIQVTNGQIYVYTVVSNSLTLLWQTTDSSINLDFPFLFGDYNGDGKTDFMIPTAVDSGLFKTFLSTGNSFVAAVNTYPFKYKEDLWNGTQQTLYCYNLISIDIDGDSRTDIIDYQTITYNGSSNGTQKIYAYHNSGITSFGYSRTPSFSSADYTSKIRNLEHYPIPIFLTSDQENSNLDFATISNNWITAFHFNKDHRRDVLLSSIENNGVRYNIDYSNLDPNEYGSDNNRVYEQAYENTYPNIDIGLSLGTKVVTSIERVVSGTPTIKQGFSYYGGVTNIEGLGFLGFKGIARSNWHENSSDRIFMTSRYDTSLRGAVTEEYTTPYYFNFSSIPSDYIIKTNNTYSSSIGTNKVFKLSLLSNTTQNTLEGTTITKSFNYDSYNNPTQISTNYSGQGSSVIDIVYANSTGSTYYIGRPESENETTTINGNAFSTERQYTYTGYLLTQKETKGNGTQFDTETYTHDVFGNIIKKITTPYNTAEREVRYEYDSSGRYLLKSYDVENLATSYEYNTNKGTLSKETNPYNQATSYFYDSWDRLIKITDYLNNNITKSYTESNYSYTVTETGDDGSGKITVYDPLKRVTTVKEKDVLGQWVSKSYQYDKLDRVSAESEPYIGSGATQWNTTEYDFYGRPETITQYNGKVTSISYSNLSATVNDGTKSVTTTKNVLGNITEVTDPGGTITYTYFGNGNLKSSNYGGQTITNEQDGWGRKTKTTDPSAGVYSYDYNGFGEITKETTPKGVTDYTYSSVGKLSQKKIVGDYTDITLAYTYNSTTKLLTSIVETSSDGNSSTYIYSYDSSKRLNSIIEESPYAKFEKSFTYDTFGRILHETNTARHLATNKSTTRSIQNTYQNGILKTITDLGQLKVLWNVDGINARGQVTSVTMGNNLRKKSTFDQFGFLTESISEKNINTTPVQIMKLTNNFDTQKGLLNSRTNSLFSWNESFTYDNLERLVSFNDNNGNKSHTYDSKGRITNNSSIGTYSYSGNSYQLAGIDLNTSGLSEYDDSISQDITYNAFKSPVDIYEEGKERISFQYNAFEGRANMFYGDTQTDKLQRRYRKHYSYDGSMEITYDKTTGSATFVIYLGGDAYSAPAIWRSEQGSTTSNDLYFLNRDYLGSIIMISDINGNIKEKRHFDAWGNIVKLTDGSNTALTKFKYLDRGYTGHEHLLGVGLIHMNGRLYDPILHRFLAPDNFIEAPFNTQNYNRYGYVLNNPLKYTDPSGEFIGLETVFFIIAAIAATASATAAVIAFVQYIQTETSSSESNVAQKPITNNNSSKSVSEPSGVPIRDGGYNINIPLGIYQSNMMQSSTSSGIAYNTMAPNDWISNGSSLGTQRSNAGALDHMGSSPYTTGTYGYADWDSGKKNQSNYEGGDETVFAEAVPIALTLSSVDGPLPIGDVIGAVVLAGATLYDATKRTFVTYTMTNNFGQVYVGRTSGYGDPLSIVKRRFASHHMRILGYGEPVIDRAVQGYHAYPAIRGREQQLIDYYGGIDNPKVGNTIRGVSKYNPAGYLYYEASNLYFGNLAPYTGFKF